MAHEDIIPEEDAYAETAGALIAAVERGPEGTWRMPWHATAGGRPVNAFTGRAFKEQNVLSLWSAARKRGFASHQWASRTAWEKKRGMIEPGEEGTAILVPVFDDEGQAERWTPGGGKPSGIGPLGGDAQGGELRKLLGFKRESWFNAAQVMGVTISAPAPPAPSEAAQLLAAALAAWRCNQASRGPALAHGGLQAHWRPDVDRVQMPPLEAFPDFDGLSGLEFYIATLAHEHVHATGSKGRLARSTLLNYKGVARAKEEMVAEIGAAFLVARFGLASRMRPDHAQYVASWLGAIAERNQQKSFLWAIAEAERAADYILAKAGLIQEERASSGRSVPADRRRERRRSR